jgi:hypothetical protein
MERILVGKPERKRPLGISRHRWEDNIKRYREIVRDSMDLIDVDQVRDHWKALVNTEMNFRIS